MKSSTRTIFTMVFLFLLIAGLYFFSDWFSKTTGYVLGEDEKIKLAQCLGQTGAVFYIENDCWDCIEQANLFGESAFKFIPVVQCSNSGDLCSNLRRIPAWEINGKFIYGKQEFKNLIEASGCDVEQS